MGKDIKETKKGKVMVNGKNEYIRFDWAAKYMLRSKADFAIFEGLINVLIDEKVEIVELLESESNQEHKDAKFNRVDIKAKDSQGRIILMRLSTRKDCRRRKCVHLPRKSSLTTKKHLLFQPKKVYLSALRKRMEGTISSC